MSAGLSTEPTLPDLLAERARRHGAAVALRHKRLGLWHSQTWSELAAQVQQLAAGLATRGFAAGDRLLIDAAAEPALFRLVLAVHWLGGSVVVRGPEAGAVAADDAARFALAGDEPARVRLLEALGDGAPVLGIILDGDASGDGATPWISLDELEHGATSLTSPAATSDAVALLHAGGGANAARLTHRALVSDARALLAAARIEARHQALIFAELPLAAQLAGVLAAWLSAGFSLGFVETAATQDLDRRELGPHVLFGAERDYAALLERISVALPARTGFEGRWVARALDGADTPARVARRLVVSRLREVAGLGRVERALVLGGAAPRTGLERLFGLQALEWPARASAAAERPETGATREDAVAEALASSALLGLGREGLAASSRSDLA